MRSLVRLAPDTMPRKGAAGGGSNDDFGPGAKSRAQKEASLKEKGAAVRFRAYLTFYRPNYCSTGGGTLLTHTLLRSTRTRPIPALHRRLRKRRPQKTRRGLKARTRAALRRRQRRSARRQSAQHARRKRTRSCAQRRTLRRRKNCAAPRRSPRGKQRPSRKNRHF